jgi:predicted PurR-regulated permease PerM
MAVGLFGLTLVLLRMVAASQRVLGWMVAAAALAGLLHPIAARLERRMPRGIAVLVVMVGSLSSVGIVGYGLVDGLVREFHSLQQAAPETAARLEREGRFAEAAQEIQLADRVRDLVNSAPERLRGGTPAEALRSAATRGVAYLATFVLTLFLLLHGPLLARGAAEQVADPERRQRLSDVTLRVYHRAFAYARGTIAMAALAGLMAFSLASLVDVPGPAPLALWVALWDVVPLIGAVVGALPIVLLATAAEPSRGLLLAIVFIAYQLIESLIVQRWVEGKSVRVGPFITVVAGFAGLEIYGAGGALMALLAATLIVALVDELAPEMPSTDPPVTTLS